MKGAFPAVNHEAFPHHDIQQLFQKAGDLGMPHHVPHQEAMIRIDKKPVGPMKTQKAFQPPVGNMEAMGAMTSLQLDLRCGDEVLYRFAAVNPDMASGG